MTHTILLKSIVLSLLALSQVYAAPSDSPPSSSDIVMAPSGPPYPSVTPPVFVTDGPATDGPRVQGIKSALKEQEHFEGGNFSETDRDPLEIPSPFPMEPLNKTFADTYGRPGFNAAVRSASTSIYFHIFPSSPIGAFHINRARHHITIQKGRGHYVLIHPAGSPAGNSDSARVEVITVGPNIEGGEKMQFIIEGGVYAASWLLPDEDGGKDSETGLLVTETVVPGWEAYDFNFVNRETLVGLVGEEGAKGMEWLLAKG